MNYTLLRKRVDWSLLGDGFAIPSEQHDFLKSLPNGKPSVGEKRPIKIMIDGELYDAKLNNVAFDRTRFVHKEVIQIRYSKMSPLALKLQQVFHTSFEYIKNAKAQLLQRQQVVMPDDIQEYITLYTTDMPDVFAIDCITNHENKVFYELATEMNEMQFEEDSFAPIFDKNTGYGISNTYHKIRRLDRSIGDSLKRLYDYRCQMTGEKIGNSHDALVIEAHHIIPFTKSLNNDTSNIIILSPNYHRIIHKANPEFDRDRLAFIYPNGLVDKVKIDKHLNI